MKGGLPPTLRKERTGLLTPPGMYCLASAKTEEDLDKVFIRIHLLYQFI